MGILQSEAEIPKRGTSAFSRLLAVDFLSIRLDWLILGAAAAGGLALVAADVFQRWIWTRSIWALDIDGRFNAVTWFHSFVLAGAALSALALAFTYRDEARRFTWWAIGGAMAFLSLDKSISLHERLGQNIEERFDLPDEAGRVIWEAVYGPFLIVLAIVLVVAVRRSSASTRLWVYLALAFCAAKVFLEGLMFPAIEADLLTEQSVIYGIEVNLEESVQLLGFAAFFAAFARLLLDRLVLMARGELDAADAQAVEHPIIDVELVRDWRSAI